MLRFPVPRAMSPEHAIAHYRVLSKIGEGGMGAVYRATDTKLNREVAIKILPDSFASDSDRLARFAREAQVLASLNHPNIAAIYGVEERALILELVEGQTLAELIGHGPIPVEESVAIGRQIAEALHYAHEHGVVHRDLKPANIKLTPDGRVKVLDFGLAKAFANDVPQPQGDPSVSPTLTIGQTRTGMIMGTAAYISPEQGRGQAVDRRSDVWAFGVVFYEMLAGRRLFDGPTISDTLAAVLTSEIDWPAIPENVRPVIERCLRRDPQERWHCVGDAGVALAAVRLGAARSIERPRAWTPWICAAALLAVAAIASGGWWSATRPLEHPLTRLSVDLGPEAVAGISNTVAVSPDGRRLVFAARGPDGKLQLATRLLDQGRMTLLPGTEGGIDPFFSPDSQWVGFFANSQLKKIPVDGGTPVTLCPASSLPRGASWGPDGEIVAALSQVNSLFRVPASGGTPQRLSKLVGGELTHRWPQVLPNGKAVLFTAASTNVGMQNASVQVLSMKTGEAKILQNAAYYGRYLPSGHLVYMHDGIFYGVRFDADRLEVRGKPVPLIEDLGADANLGGGQFSFSSAPDTGTFVYLPGKAFVQRWQVAWLDRSGKTEPLIATPGLYATLCVSADGKKVAYYDGADIYVRDSQRDVATPLTFNGNGRRPTWAPDGKHLVYTIISGNTGLYWARSDGSGEPQRILDTQARVFSSSFSPDGRELVYFDMKPDGGGDLYTMSMDLTDPEHPKAGTPKVFLSTVARTSVARISPDGRWIAYASSEQGRVQVYVRPFPHGSGVWPVSIDGGTYPLWSQNGKELFFEAEDNRIMVVEYSVEGDAFVARKPRLWSEKVIFHLGGQNIDIAPDGKRFAVLTNPSSAAESKDSVHITMLLNFFDEVRRRIP